MRSTPLVHGHFSSHSLIIWYNIHPLYLLKHRYCCVCPLLIISLCTNAANSFFLSSEQTVFCTISLKPSYLFHTVYVCWKFWSVFSLTHLHKAFCRGSSSDALMIQLDLKQLYSQQFNFCFPQNSILFFSFSLFFYCLFSSHSCICFCLSNSGLRDGRSLSQLS